MIPWWTLYYIVCVLLWLFLAAMAVWSFWPSLARWLAGHPGAAGWLLGVERLPAGSERTLRRFYLYLAGGWTWLLVWSWWLLPWCKHLFYRSASTLHAYQLARVSTLILVVATAVFGFYGIGRGIQIWQRDIYNSSK